MNVVLGNLDGQDKVTILREIQSTLCDLHFGVVEIIVYNDQAVQIEHREKFRLQQPAVRQT